MKAWANPASREHETGSRKCSEIPQTRDLCMETRDLRARIKLNDHVNRVCLFMTSLHGGSESGNESTTSTPRSEDTSSSQSTMATGFNLPPPPPLEIHDDNIAEKWKKFRLAWSNYSLATELNKKTEAIQVATLLTVIGEEARDVYSTFDWSDEGNKSKIEPVLQQFADYCQPRKNVPFERYRFNKRAQKAGESYDQYKTALRKLAEGCEFHTITSEEILRDRFRDVKVRERLLRESQLTLKKTDEICRASESTAAQLKEVSEGDTVSLGVHVARKETPASQQKNVEIVGGYTSQIIVLLAVKHAATVVD